MKINSVNNFMGYKGNTLKINRNEITKSKNYDTIQINKNNIKCHDVNDLFDLDKLKEKLTKEVEGQSNYNKIEQVKQQMNNRVYAVNSNEIAKILLDI